MSQGEPRLLVTTTIQISHFPWSLMTSIQKSKQCDMKWFGGGSYYRCLNCFCRWLFPGNEHKWIEKCRWTWTAAGEIDSTAADISMIKTETRAEGTRNGDAGWDGLCDPSALDHTSCSASVHPGTTSIYCLAFLRCSCIWIINMANAGINDNVIHYPTGDILLMFMVYIPI